MIANILLADFLLDRWNPGADLTKEEQKELRSFFTGIDAEWRDFKQTYEFWEYVREHFVPEGHLLRHEIDEFDILEDKVGYYDLCKAYAEHTVTFSIGDKFYQFDYLETSDGNDTSNTIVHEVIPYTETIEVTHYRRT